MAGRLGCRAIPFEATLRITSATSVRPTPSDGVIGPVLNVATADSSSGYNSFELYGLPGSSVVVQKLSLKGESPNAYARMDDAPICHC